MKSDFDFRRYDAWINRAVQLVNDVPRKSDNHIIVRYACKVYLRILYDYFCENYELPNYGVFAAGLVSLQDMWRKHGIVDYAKFMKHMKAEFVRCDNPNLNFFRKLTQSYYGVDEARKYIPFIKILFTAQGTISSFRGFNIILSYLLKMNLDNESIIQQAIDDYRDLEEHYPQGDLSSELVETMRRFANQWLANFPMHVDEFYFSHGSGSTAIKETGTDIALKTEHMVFDRLLLNALSRSTTLDPQRFIPPSVRKKRTFGNIRCSRLVTVPKNLEKRRTISMEHPMLMYFQHGVQRELYDYLEQPRFHGHINFRNNWYNRYAAYLGSKYPDTYSTIDLSCASDLVSYDLVRLLFKDTPLMRWLIATRSTHTSVNGELIELKKFAPMGSALCFPIESLVFALACESTLYLEGAARPYTYRVYGDDICFPPIHTPALMRNLESLGFKVNTEKSFWIGGYRESCGMEFLNGINVTPFYFRPETFRDKVDAVHHYYTPKAIAHLVCKANELASVYYRSSRAYIVDTIYYALEGNYGPALTTDVTRSDALYSLCDPVTCWDPRLQRRFQMVTSVTAPVENAKTTGADTYFYTLYLNKYRHKCRDAVVFNGGRRNLEFRQRRSYF